MSLQGSKSLSTVHSKSPLDGILIKNLLLSHDPDGRHLDSDHLLQAMENIVLYATMSEESFQVPDPHFDTDAEREITGIEIIGLEEPYAHIVQKISNEIICKFSTEGILHERTMLLFDLLGNYRWDDKAVLALAAFATSYGEFWLLMQLYPRNPVAVAVVMLKQLPSDLSTFKRQFKALSLLMKTVIDLTKCVVKFESLPLSHVKLDIGAKSIKELHLYSAVYWIIRSILTCCSQIRDFRELKPEQVHPSSLNRFVHSSFGNNRNMGALKFGPSAKGHIGLTELKNKVVILLISKPGFLSTEESLFLVQQTYDHPDHNQNLEGISYEIVWIPISVSDSWTDAEKRSFRRISHSLPWCLIKHPWSLHLQAVKFIRKEWKYADNRIMVVLDSQGNVSNKNAMDMVFVWGPRAYPFSDSREQELWLEQWTLQLLVDDIDPLLTKRVQEDRYLCIYGSNNKDWILKLNSKMKEITENTGVKLEMVYVGKRKPREHVVKNILHTLEDGKHLLSLLSQIKLMQFFWLRMESIIRLKLRQGDTAATNNSLLLQEVSYVIDMDENDQDWALIGRGSSKTIVGVEGMKLMECLNDFEAWKENVGKLGFLVAIKTALEPPLLDEPCGHSELVSEEYGKRREDMEVCVICRRPMEKFVVYK
ncbi:hypothetical protein L484_027653 [Morus notabilis]|uniref:Protein SIEVE ELEMENT OCCLUSION C n=1 Tax=Morus notabilis TaxID=981085 RepID=W9RCL8_9ROSA|nr:hypothetical protein L484_027653 [Morus notabilis]